MVRGGALRAMGAGVLLLLLGADPGLAVRPDRVLLKIEGHDTTALGNNAAGLGDVDGDGVPDVAALDPSGPEPECGSIETIHIFSGADGRELWQRKGDGFCRTDLGWGMAGVGDLNGDGVPDLLVSAMAEGDSGRVYLLSGDDGRVLWVVEGAQLPSCDQDPVGFCSIGQPVAKVGDVDGDGVPDVAVGAPGWGGFPQEAVGHVSLLSGRDGRELWFVSGDQVYESFGAAVAGVGDLDGDGIPDLLASSGFGDSAGGLVRALSGGDGRELWRVDRRSTERDGFGLGLAGLGGDVDGDGIPEVIVQVPGAGWAWLPGAVELLSGRDGRSLWRASLAFPLVGSTPVSIGDLDGDGIPDLAIGTAAAAPAGTGSGQVLVFSGKDGRMLLTLDGEAQGESFGDGLDAAGDWDGDGVQELVVGAPGFRDAQGDARGAVYVVTLRSRLRPSGLRVLQPNGGEVWSVGSLHVIRWQGGGVGPVQLELSRDGGRTWELLTTLHRNPHRWLWRVTGPATQEARIRVTSRGREDMSDGDFTLAPR